MPTKYTGSAEEVRALDAYIKLMRCANSVTSRLNPLLGSAGLTTSQFGVLEALFHLGPLHQKDLGEKLLLSGGNITMVVNNLEKQGLVVRLKTGTDRRYVSVHLTWRGTEVIKRIFPQHLKEIMQQFSVLSDEEQEQLGRICKKLGLGK